MPFIDPQDKTKLEAIQLRMRPEVVSDLNAYARMLDDSEPSYVVQEILKRVFEKENEFKKWKAKQGTPSEITASAKKVVAA